MPWLKRNFQHWLIYVILLHLASSNVKKGSHCKYLCFRNWDNFVSVCCSNRAMWQWERSNTNKIVLFAELSGVLLLLLSFGNTYNSKTYEDSRAVPASTSVCVCVVMVVLGKGVLQPQAGERSALFLSDRLDRKTRAGARGRNGRGGVVGKTAGLYNKKRGGRLWEGELSWEAQTCAELWVDAKKMQNTDFNHQYCKKVSVVFLLKTLWLLINYFVFLYVG